MNDDRSSSSGLKTIGDILSRSPEQIAQDRIKDQIRENKRLSNNAPAYDPSKRPVPRSQRDELFQYFFDLLSGPYRTFTRRALTPAHLASKIAHLSVNDLFYLKSTCDDAERRGQPFSKVFWGSLKPRSDSAQVGARIERRGV